MDAPVPPLPKACWACAKVLDPSDRFCRYCGQGQGDEVSWYYKGWGIAVAALLGLGPFALVLVFRSPVLSRAEKWFWSVFILAGSGWVLYRGYQSYKMAMEILNGGLGGLGL